MKVSKRFLEEYVPIQEIDFREIAERMVLAGNEYESVGKISDATNIVVGQITDCKMHPASDKLHICQVDVGTDTRQILCGADNVCVGAKVMVALPGAVLPGGVEIKCAKLAGKVSNGMICALGELGIETKYLNQEEREGIHILPQDAPIGSDAIHYIGYDDEVIDFELTPNRADLLNYLGMAYEVGALYHLPVILPENKIETSTHNIEDCYRLDVKTKNCPLYLGKVVKNVTIAESPEWLKNRLMASGIRPINNVVDISNYVMLEYGQPLHFFDADRLGKHIIVRQAKKNEKLITLDGVHRTLQTSDIVIATEEESVALAGVMGGLSTEVEKDTRNIFIESAIFDSAHIRNTAKAILRSEASSRYEKGIDPNRSREALMRACYLLHTLAGGEVEGGELCHDVAKKQEKVIKVQLSKINAVLGMKLERETVRKIFEDLQFTVVENRGTFTVTVPTRRLDITIAEDLIEEVGRIYGYDHVSGVMPVVPIKRGSYTPRMRLTKTIRKRLEALGLNEVITYSLTGEKEVTQFVDHEFEPVVLKNPMSEDRKVLRNSLLPSLLNVFDYNFSRSQKDICIFETGAVYEKNKDNYVEERKVSGLLFGNYLLNQWQGKIVRVDFYVVKGIIENLLQYLGFNRRYQFTTEGVIADLHPNRSCAIWIDKEVVGYFGQVHPNVYKKEVYVFEISIDKLLSKAVRGIKFKETPKYPSIKKDMAFVMNKDVPSEKILEVIRRVGSRILVDVDVFDVYVGENVKENEKSIAYSLTFQDSTKTLSDEEVTTLFNKIIHEVEVKCHVELRDK